MATASAARTPSTSIVVVGASPQALPDLRKDQTLLFIDLPEDAPDQIPVSNDVRYLVIANRVCESERVEVTKAAKQFIPYAEVTMVTPPRTLRDTILALQNEPSTVPTIVEYTSVNDAGIPKGTIVDNGVLVIPWHRIKRFEDQPRIYFNHEKLELLATSITMMGQVTPGLVRRITGDSRFDYQLVDGERRWLACKIADKPFRATSSQIKNSAEHYAKSAIANFGGEAHTPMETARALNKVRSMQKLTLQQLANLFTRSVGWVQQHLDLLKLAPEVQAMLEPGDERKRPLKLLVALKLRSLPADFQIRMADTVIKRKFKMARANAFIRKEAIAAGLVAGERTRSPKQDFNLLSNYLSRTVDQGKIFQEMTDKGFAGMFEHRLPSVKLDTLIEIDNCIASLSRLKKRVSAAKTMNDF